jgi:hypothetical protein
LYSGKTTIVGKIKTMPDNMEYHVPKPRSQTSYMAGKKISSGWADVKRAKEEIKRPDRPNAFDKQPKRKPKKRKSSSDSDSDDSSDKDKDFSVKIKSKNRSQTVKQTKLKPPSKTKKTSKNEDDEVDDAFGWGDDKPKKETKKEEDEDFEFGFKNNENDDLDPFGFVNDTSNQPKKEDNVTSQLAGLNFGEVNPPTAPQQTTDPFAPPVPKQQPDPFAPPVSKQQPDPFAPPVVQKESPASNPFDAFNLNKMEPAVTTAAQPASDPFPTTGFSNSGFGPQQQQNTWGGTGTTQVQPSQDAFGNFGSGFGQGGSGFPSSNFSANFTAPSNFGTDVPKPAPTTENENKPSSTNPLPAGVKGLDLFN